MYNVESSGFDYEQEYDGYWRRPDRWGSDSFEDASELVNTLLTHCGQGPVLDVGCGMGRLVRQLWTRGVDAHGVDVAPPVIEHGNSQAPGRFHQGSALDLPFPDERFDTLLSTGCLVHIAPGDVPRVLAEFHRVTRRYLFVRLATTPDRDRRWHLTVQPRPWWEQEFIKAGFRRHPRMLQVRSFVHLQQDDWQVLMLWEKVPGNPSPASARDFLRQVGAEAEAAQGRATYAATCIRPRDRVLVTGLGATATAAVINHCADTAELHVLETGPADLRDASIDFLYLETHHPPELLAQAQRILTPGGRLLLCENMEHTATAALDESLLPEQTFLQDTGQNGAARRFDPVDSDDGPLSSGHYRLRVLMKNPHACAGAQWTGDPDAGNLLAFGRDYENPWLIDSMVVWGRRAHSPTLLQRIARETVEHPEYTLKSADRGAALCVLAYQLLEADTPDPAELADIISSIHIFLSLPSDNPHQFRWHVSLQFVLGCLHQWAGRMAEAEDAFADCAGEDALLFSPLLGTKTVGAALRAGRLALGRADTKTAAEHWQHGLEEALRLLRAPPSELAGALEDPLPWALAEAGQLTELARQCAESLQGLSHWRQLPQRAVSGCADSLADREKLHLRLLDQAQKDKAELARTNAPLHAGLLATASALLQQVAQSRAVYCWGAGSAGLRILTALGKAESNVTAFVDADPDKAGTVLSGKKVVNPADLLTAHHRPFFCITSSCAPDIERTLNDAGFAPGTDYVDLSSLLQSL